MSVVFKQANLAPDATGKPVILALPKGRILSECAPLLAGAGIVPSAGYDNDDSRHLRFATNDPGLDVIRVRSFCIHSRYSDYSEL